MRSLLRFLVFATATALLLGVPTSVRAAEGYLEGLRVIAIHAETPSKDAQDDKITKQMMEDQALLTIRSKAPNLRIDPNAGPFLYVNLTYLPISPTSYTAFFRVELARPVEVLIGVDLPGQSSSRRIRAAVPVWNTGDIFTGNRGRAAERVRSVLDQLLQEFVAAYYRANPH